MNEMDRIGRRSALACPDCHGVMWEIDEGALVRYRCHLGHAYIEEVMRLALDDNLRRALASGLRAVEERAAMARRLSGQANDRGHARSAEHWARNADEFEREADNIRKSMQRLDESASLPGAAQ